MLAAVSLMVACGGKKQDTRGDIEKLAGLFPAGKPVLPAVFGKHSLAHGMSTSAADAAAPEFTNGSLAAKELSGVRFGFDAYSDSRGIYSLYVELNVAPEEAHAMLVDKWGTPKDGSDSEGDRWYWFNPGSRLRAVLYKNMVGWMHVSFERYLPIADMLGKHATMLGWETSPLLGMSGDEVAATYGEYLAGAIPDEDGEAPTQLILPGAEYAANTLVLLDYTVEGAEVVSGMLMLLSADAYPAGIDEMLEAFKAKYGDAEIDDVRNALVFSTAPVVRVERVENGLSVSVQRAPPVSGAE